MKLIQYLKQKFVLISILLIMLIVPFSLAYTQTAVAQTAIANNTKTKSPDDIKFEQLIEQSYAAWNTRNSDEMAKYFANDADLVIFDAPSFKYQGWSGLKNGVQKDIFDKTTSFKLSANDDLRAKKQGDFAWTTSTWHLEAKFKDGRPLSADGRQTDIWKKRNGKWLIVHEHTSVPLG